MLGDTLLYLSKTSCGLSLPNNRIEFLMEQIHKWLGDLPSSWKVYSLISDVSKNFLGKQVVYLV